MDVTGLTEIVLTLLGLVAVGWLLKRFGVLSAEDSRPIHAVIVYAGLPALVFRSVHGAELSTELALVAAVAWVVFALSALLAWGATRALRLPPRVAGGFIIAAALGNTGYIGYPVAQALLGDAGLVRAIFYDVFGTVGALLFVGLVIAQHYGRIGESGSEAGGAPALEPVASRVSRHAGRVNPLREALTFPAVIALGVAVLTRPLPVPEVVSSGIDALAMLVVPLIMLSVGLTLEVRRMAHRPIALGMLAVIRLLVAPLVAIVVGSLLLDDPAALRLVVLEAGMPAMMLSIVVGARFGLDREFLTSAVVLTTVASVATIPLMQLIVG